LVKFGAGGPDKPGKSRKAETIKLCLKKVAPEQG